MPKKGTRIASSQAKAREHARRKAHRAGPVLPAAAYEPPTSEPEDIAQDAELEQAATAPTPAAPAAVRRSAPSARREHAAAAAISVSNVRNELLRIGAVTAVIAAALAALKLATDIGA